MAGCEQRSRDVFGLLRRNVGDNASLIFVGTDIVDRDIALAEQIAQRDSCRFRHLQFALTGCLQLRRVDAAQPDPCVR